MSLGVVGVMGLLTDKLDNTRVLLPDWLFPGRSERVGRTWSWPSGLAYLFPAKARPTPYQYCRRSPAEREQAKHPRNWERSRSDNNSVLLPQRPTYQVSKWSRSNDRQHATACGMVPIVTRVIRKWLLTFGAVRFLAEHFATARSCRHTTTR